MSLKKRHIVTKVIWQCLLTLIEFGGIAFLFCFLTIRIVPCGSFIDIINRFFMGIAIYEFFIFLTLSNINDAKRDTYLALTTALKKAILILESNDSEMRKRLLKIIDKQLDTGTLNFIDVRSQYKEIQTILNADNPIMIPFLKDRLISAEHNQQAASLKWKFSLLLRLIK